MRQRTIGITVDGLHVTVTFKRMKNMRLRVNPPEGRVTVSVPHGTPTSRIREYVVDHHDWIRHSQQLVRTRYVLDVPRTRGSEAMLWGEWTPLSSLGVDTSHPDDRTAALDRYFVEVLRPAVDNLRKLLEPAMGAYASRVRFRRMKSRWGSCNHQTASITLNTALAEAPPWALEYVLVHELAHVLVRGHGPEFRAVMDRTLPDWRARRTALNNW